MNPVLRVTVLLMTFFGTYVLSVIILMILSLDSAGQVLALLIALAVSFMVWPHTRNMPRSALGAAGYGAAILGSIGFVAGFFGPMLLAPEANQGPLLGIFITGPGGALLGAVAGLVYGLRRRTPD
jgi:hypothetical protein